MTRIMMRGSIDAMTLALVVVTTVLTGCAETIPQPPNSAPAADAGPDQTVTAGDTVTLQGSGSDAEDDRLTYSWSQTGAPSVELRNPNQAAASFIAPAVDADTLLTFTLSVIDSGGLTSGDTVTVTVQPKPPEPPPNSVPTADAGSDQAVTVGDTVTLQGTGTDAEDDNLVYSWSQTGGMPHVELRGTDRAATSFIAPAVDADTMLTFTLSVTDSGGLTGADTVTVTVMPALSLGFAEDSVRVAEGEEVSVGIRYRVRELASPLTIQVSVRKNKAEAADYELSETRFEIPAGRDIEGTLELVIGARADDAFAEGEETIELRLLLPDAIGAEVRGGLSVTITDTPVSACVGVTLAGTPPEPVEEVSGLRSLLQRRDRIRTSLTSEWHPSARGVTMRWVGPYGEGWEWFDLEPHPNYRYHEEAKPLPPQPDFHIEAWRFDAGSTFATHVMDVSWSREADLELMFRCETGDVSAVCDAEGCRMHEGTASDSTLGSRTALQSALWGNSPRNGPQEGALALPDGREPVPSTLRASYLLYYPGGRWHPSVWGPGETLVFYLSTENWPVDARMTPEEVKEVLERMLAEWSAIPTADISWRVEGPVDGLLPGKDGKNIFFIDPAHGHGTGETFRWYDTIDGISGMVEWDHRMEPGTVSHPKHVYDNAGAYITWGFGMHPLGHALGLDHAATFPVFASCPGPEGDQCYGVASTPAYWRAVSGAWQLDPIMSYGASGALTFVDGGATLRLDDKIGASLLRPKPGWLETTGAIAGSVSYDDGRPVPFVHVWAVRPDEHGLMDGVGSFADRNGDFLIRGLSPGDWILIAHPDLSWMANPWFFFERQGELTDEMLLYPVRARAGQTTSGIEITMSRGRKTTVVADR